MCVHYEYHGFMNYRVVLCYVALCVSWVHKLYRVVQSNLVLRSVEEAVVYSSFVIGQLIHEQSVNSISLSQDV